MWLFSIFPGVAPKRADILHAVDLYTGEAAADARRDFSFNSVVVFVDDGKMLRFLTDQSSAATFERGKEWPLHHHHPDHSGLKKTSN